HGVVDFDWDFIAVTAPAVAVLGVLLAAGRPARVRLRARRGVLAVAAGAFAAAALYSLASPWLAARRGDDAYAALSRGDAWRAVDERLREMRGDLPRPVREKALAVVVEAGDLGEPGLLEEALEAARRVAHLGDAVLVARIAALEAVLPVRLDEQEAAAGAQRL